MYFPYIHGRQAELAAVTDLSTNLGTPQLIYPLIEPVDPPAGLQRALGKLKSAGRQTYVVVNPQQGALRDHAARASWSKAIAPHLADGTLTRPVLLESATTTPAEIAAFASAYPGRKIAVVLASTRLAPADVAAALGPSDFFVFLRPGVNPVGYAASVGANRIVEISDNFNRQERNADYSGVEWLANNHLAYASAGNPGFSDFTILPGFYVSGGGPVGAAAFHLSYPETDNSLWIQHFVSDETDRNVGTSSSKLLEAMTHLQAQISSTPARFPQSPALATYRAQLAAGTPTNLSNNKKQQIAHHLFAVGQQLGL